MSRYIDADAFETFGYAVDGGNDDFKDGFDEGVQFVLECIDEQPTADVKPVVRGEWICCEDDEWIHYECSVCGEIIHHETLNFCPNCGADMRGEV